MTFSPYLIIFCDDVHSNDHIMSYILSPLMNGTVADVDSFYT
jgi:hypothetical protein